MSLTNEVKTSDLLDEYIDLTQDDTQRNKTLGKRRIQRFYTFLLAEANNYTTERTKYGNLKADQRSYLLPPDTTMLKNVRIKFGENQWQPLIEVKNIDDWHRLTMVKRTSNIPQTFCIFKEEGQPYIEIDPIPNADVEFGIEMIYEGHHSPLSFPDDYSVGTVTIEQGSPNVVGITANFSISLVRRFIRTNEWWYEISSVPTTDQLVLTNYFQEPSVTNVEYEIAELPRLPFEFHYTPLWGAVELYWSKENKDRAAEFEKKFVRELLMLQSKYKTKSKGGITPGRPVDLRRRRLYGVPRNYPTSPLSRLQ